MKDNKKNKNRELNEFQIRNIRILTHLLMHEAVSDEIVEYLRKSELDYFSLIDKYQLLEKKANIDEKTSLLKYKNDYLTNIIKTASRIYHGMKETKYDISFIRFDIDDFSVFNNQYGHDIGDRVLIKLAEILRKYSRPTDYVIRFGGEEFDIILPTTDLKGAEIYTSNIFDKVKGMFVKHDRKKLKVTVSAGLSAMEYVFSGDKHLDENEIKKNYKTLQIEADNALYEAKYLGKNRYCIFSKHKKNDYAKIRKQYVK